jgi:hypothetical protein
VTIAKHKVVGSKPITRSNKFSVNSKLSEIANDVRVNDLLRGILWTVSLRIGRSPSLSTGFQRIDCFLFGSLPNLAVSREHR